ncbi:MAG: mechanosensitive ion channel domain-containing protein [Thermoplasmata archaeon]
MDIYYLIKMITIPLIITVGIIVILLYLVAYLNRFFNYLKIKESKLIGKESIEWLEVLLLYTIFSMSLIILIRIFSYLSPEISYYTADMVFPFFSIFFSIFLIILFSMFLLAINSRAFRYLRGELSIKPEKPISEKFGYYLELIIKYIIYLFAVLASVIIIFAGFNMLRDAERAFYKFIWENIEGIVLNIIFIVIMIIVYLLLIAYIRDIKLRSKYQKEKLLKYLSAIIRNAVITILLLGITMIILSMLGFSFADIFVFIFFITAILIGVFLVFLTPIKNAISGIIILITEPFLEDDYVIIENNIEGVILNINLLYTEIREKDGKIRYVPNYKILEGPVKVITSPGKMFQLNFEFSLPSKVPYEKVEDICLNATSEIPGIVLNEKPRIFIKELFSDRITYSLKIYIEDPLQADNIKSEILKRIKSAMDEGR